MKLIKPFIKGIIIFIKNMLSTGTNESAKRTMAVIIIINIIIIAFICVFMDSQAPEIVPLMFKGAILLLGLEITSDTIKSLKNKK